jgi:hypothetical protein
VKHPVKIAFIAAIPVEAANFWFASHFPIDVGIPPDASVWVRLVLTQSLFMHYPVFLLIGWFDELPAKIQAPLFDLCLAVCGYAETVLLFLAAAFVFTCLRRLTGKLTARPNRSATPKSPVP